MIIDNLKISVRYPKKSFFSPPIFGQICCRKIGKWLHSLTAEIINENDSVALYKNRIEVKAYDEKGYFLGKNGPLRNASNIILYLRPKEKYIFVTHLSFPSPTFDDPRSPPLSTMLFSSRNLYELKFRFYKLKWRDLSFYHLPKVIVSNDLLIEKNTKHILQFNITNLSSSLHSFQVNVGFYSHDGKLIGGAMGLAHRNIKVNVPKTMKIKIPFELPSDCKYIIQPHANTPWLLLFLKKRASISNQ